MRIYDPRCRKIFSRPAASSPLRVALPLQHVRAPVYISANLIPLLFPLYENEWYASLARFTSFHRQRALKSIAARDPSVPPNPLFPFFTSPPVLPMSPPSLQFFLLFSYRVYSVSRKTRWSIVRIYALMNLESTPPSRRFKRNSLSLFLFRSSSLAYPLAHSLCSLQVPKIFNVRLLGS